MSIIKIILILYVIGGILSILTAFLLFFPLLKYMKKTNAKTLVLIYDNIVFSHPTHPISRFMQGPTVYNTICTILYKFMGTWISLILMILASIVFIILIPFTKK